MDHLEQQVTADAQGFVHVQTGHPGASVRVVVDIVAVAEPTPHAALRQLRRKWQLPVQGLTLADSGQTIATGCSCRISCCAKWSGS